MSPSFSVLLASPDDAPPETVSRLLAAFLDVPQIDSRRLANHAWGFLGEKLEEADAARLKELAAQAGLETFIAPADEILLPPPSHAVTGARFSADALSFSSRAGEISLPPGKASLLCAVGLTEESSFLKTVHEGPSAGRKALKLGLLAAGIPTPGWGKSKDVQKTVKSSEFFLYMDIFTQDPPDRLHVDAQAFDFSCLGERLTPASFGNFRLFLQDVSRAAPAAVRNRGARMMLEGRPFAAMGYASKDDYEKECRWLWALARRTA
ncbi:MAG: hypothetical protein ACT4O3_04215 [Elusimicrobiota bacterium]